MQQSRQLPSAKYILKNFIFFALFITINASAQSMGCSAKFHYDAVDFNVFNFYADSADSDKSLHWDFGDGTTSTERNPKHTYPTKDNGYRIVLTVYSNLDTTCNDSYVSYLKVYPTCNAWFTYKRSSSDHKSIAINNLSTGKGNVSYEWSFGDGTTSTVSQPGTHVYTNNDLHIITLKIHDSIGCESTFRDSIFSPCSAEFHTSLYKNEADLHINYYDTISVKYTWNFGDGTPDTIINTPDVKYFYKSDGTYKVCLTTQSLIDSSCTDTQCQSFTVKTPNTCKADFTWRHDSINHNKVIFANNSFGYNLTYFWDFGDGTTSDLKSPSHTYLTDSNRVVCLKIKDSQNGCSDTICGTVTLFECFISADFEYLKKPGANDATYLFNPFAQNDVNHNWDFGDGTTSILANPTHTFPTDNTYLVCLTVTSVKDIKCSAKIGRILGGRPDSICKALFTFEPSSTSNPLDLIVNDQSTGSHLNYFWDFGDGSSSSLKTPTHDYDGTGPYLICLTVKNDSCTNTYCDTLSVKDTAHRSTDKFTIRVISKTTDIIEDAVDQNNLQNYPNPFTNNITIKYVLTSGANVQLTVFNVLGSKVETLENTKKSPGTYNIEWSPQQLQQGIYILQLKVNDQIITKKMIKN